MKHFTKQLSSGLALVAGICTLVFASQALGENETPENAQMLLEKVKRRDLDRQVAGKQTELDRLAQDLAKQHKDAETMQQSVDTTGSMLKASGDALDQLVNDKKRLEQVLELTALKIEAERLKVDGLRMLAEAQAKSLTSLTRHAEETDARATLGAAEMKLLAENAPEPTGKARSPLYELRKKLAVCESATATAERLARDAMRSASSRLEQADVASVRAKRKASGMEGELPEIAEKPEIADEKPLDKPVEKAPEPAKPAFKKP